jgi:hypothetical protein
MGIDVRVCIDPNDAGVGVSPGLPVTPIVERDQ